jgi:DNA ligase-associated metallophosphoesterase
LALPGDLQVTIAGEPVTLLPERALFWPGGRALLIADAHLGKAAAFRAAAIAVPEALTAADLARLDRALDRSGAERLIVLGDLLHARSGRSPAVLDAVAAWRARRPGLDLLLVRGNHDRGAGDPPPAWGAACTDEPHPLPPFVLRHLPGADPAGHVLAGHLHPAAALVGPGRQRERLPCFLVGLDMTVLPAFGGFTGAATVRPRRGERVYVVAGERVLAVHD